MKVTFVGLGNMGSGIASCIQRAGIDLTVYNRTREKMQPLLAAGAKGAADIGEAVRDADLVITALMDDQSVLDTVKTSLLGNMKPGAIHLGVTTISPQCADELARLHRAAGTIYIAGPIVGRPNAAAAGELLSYLAGDKAAVKKVTPVCKAYSKTVKYVSEHHGAANSLKLCINYTVAAIIEAFGEVYVFAEKSGVDLNILREFLENAMGHPALKMYTGKIMNRNFDGKDGFAMVGGLKDVTLMLNASSAVGASLDIGKIAQKKMQAAIAAGMAQNDWSATYEITRQNAGLK